MYHRTAAQYCSFGNKPGNFRCALITIVWQTKLDVFLIPRVADLFDRLGKATVFSSIDLRHAYHWVRIHESDEQKTTFLTPHGLFEYLVIPIGLCNAPAMFPCLMNLTFSDLMCCMTIYLDDILV